MDGSRERGLAIGAVLDPEFSDLDCNRTRDQLEIFRGQGSADIFLAWLAKLRSHVLGTVTLASWDETTAVPYCSLLELYMSWSSGPSVAKNKLGSHGFLRRAMLRPVEWFRCSSGRFGPQLLWPPAALFLLLFLVASNSRGYTAGASRIAQSLASELSAKARLS